ncbi:MAG: sigma 54-interacting transcriptional regulator [Chlorobiaceae bacterium]|nr:sigma 54-interacting transcriptional regulator [Chlorobiaceae bacterium]
MKRNAPSESRQLLKYISDAIGTIRDPGELFRTIINRLRLMFYFDSGAIITLSSEGRHLEIFFDTSRTVLPEWLQEQKQLIAEALIENHREDHEVKALSIENDSFGENEKSRKVLQSFHEHGIRQIILSPLRPGGRLIGFLTLISRQQTEWAQAQKDLLADISLPIAMSVSNALAYEELRQKEAETSMQLTINNLLLTIKDRHSMLLAVCEEIAKLVSCTFMGIRVIGQNGKFLVADNYMLDSGKRFRHFSPVEYLDPEQENGSIAQEGVELISKSGIFSNREFIELSREYKIIELLRERYRICSLISHQLWQSYGSKAGLFIAATDRAFSNEDMETIRLIVPQLSLSLQNYLAFEEIDSLRRKLEGEKTYLIEEIRSAHNFEEIIGNSDALVSVLQKVRLVAPTDATVLMQSETGTGKELIARAIHNLSPRKESVLVKVNCAALPAALIESELFGHEKGSFTGAIDRRIGKFELADGGTIFLDEIGELPIDLQAKLLRVLQERELERIGGRKTIPVNVRVIAATNKKLEKEVAEGRFREDLYFRLNVFPLFLPPLRERRSDIPPLAIHFAIKYAREFGRPVRSIRESDMRDLCTRDWKGNIRELAHCVEQAVIMSEGEMLDFSSIVTPKASTKRALDPSGKLMTLPELEKEQREKELSIILAALDRAAGRVSGKGGAAEILDINPKTLFSRIDALGIRKRYTP